MMMMIVIIFYYKIEKESKRNDYYVKSDSHNFVLDNKCPKGKNRSRNVKSYYYITMYSVSCVIKLIMP